MFLKKEREGYVLIDHRESPGFTCDEAPAAYRAGIPVGAGALFEGATNMCGHWPCGRQVVMNPDRVRARGHCWSCDHYVCDDCAVALRQTGVCIPFEKGAAEYLERAAKAELVAP